MLTKRHRKLWGYIARHHEDKGEVPVISQICYDLKMSTVEASNGLWLLVKEGYLTPPQKMHRDRYLWNTSTPRVPLQRTYFKFNDQSQKLEALD